MDAVLETESVFTPNMNREERFDMYQQIMNERIKNARAPVAKKALEALRDLYGDGVKDDTYLRYIL